jgi:hypothetical protein
MGGEARDFGAEVNALVARIEADPSDAAAREDLLRVAGEWVLADGLGEPAAPEREERVRLAGWLARLVDDGPVAHFGWRVGAVAAALGSRGAHVSSLLDHPARSMVAALRHGSERVAFGVHAQAEDLPRAGADLVVLETAGIRPVVDPALARRCLRPEGYLAVIGMPVMLDLPFTVDVACFRDEAEGTIVPCRPGACAEMLTLLRSIARPARPEVREPRGPAADATVAGKDDPVAEFRERVARLLGSNA